MSKETELAMRLRKLRDARRESQQEAADAIGVPKPTYANWELGRGTPALSMIPVIARHYHITTDDLLGADTDLIHQQIMARIASFPEDKRKALLTLLEFPVE